MVDINRDGRRGDRSTTVSGPVQAGGGTIDRVGTIGSISAGNITVSNPTPAAPTSTIGGQEYVATGDVELRNVNKQILESLKRVEIHLMKITNLKL